MNSLTEMVDREPLQSSNGNMIKLWKDNTPLRRHLLRLCPVVEVMVKLDEVFGDQQISIDWSSRWSFETAYVLVECNSEEEARSAVGKLIMSFKKKPKVKKVSDDQLQAIFEFEEANVIVTGYKPKTCRYEEIEIKVPAQRRRIEKKVIPAQKAHIEKRRVLVCDDVKSEPQIPQEVESVSEVPF